MAKKRVEKIAIRNFKAFREREEIDFKNKNVLIYGNNGAGKSSIFWAIYTFLQSSIKSKVAIDRYFKVFNENDEQTFQSLRNIFEGADSESYIELTISEGTKKTALRIANNDHQTIGDKDIKILNATSDFFNYKLLSNFYRDSHKYSVNIWPVFERDIFPFLTDNVSDESILEKIKRITKDVPRTPNGYAVGKSRNKENYKKQVDDLNKEIEAFLNDVQKYANEFIIEHFFEKKDVLQIILEYDKQFHFDQIKNKIWEDDKVDQRFGSLRIKLIIKQFDQANNKWIPIQRVQSFLNEAQLTRIAISIRIGALRTRIQDSDLKLLVLDDMLISLDMANRIEVVKMILNYGNKKSLRFFDGFQKIILTHDKGFYNILKNFTNSNEWEYYNLSKKEKSNNAPSLKNERNNIEKAQKFLADGEFDSCGNELRKEVETILKKYLTGLNDDNGEFKELSKMLKSAYEKYTQNERRAFEKLFVKKEIPLEKLKKIDGDIDTDDDLNDDEKKELLIVKKELFNYLYKQYEVKEEKDKLFEEIKTIMDRIMNPSSHASTEPLYEQELENAIGKVIELNEVLNK